MVANQTEYLPNLRYRNNTHYLGKIACNISDSAIFYFDIKITSYIKRNISIF